MPRADLNFVSVGLFFMVMEPFTDVLREIWPAVTRKIAKDLRTADCTDPTDGVLGWRLTQTSTIRRLIRRARRSRSTTSFESRLHLCYPCSLGEVLPGCERGEG